jgi:hypothetical protein
MSSGSPVMRLNEEHSPPGAFAFNRAEAGHA